MTNHIAAGFQNTVDFEILWDTSKLQALISQYHITSAEISTSKEISSERDLLIVLLAHMIAGNGSECLAASSQITRTFASHFSYQVTLGGTAVRAAMAIEKIGYRSTIHACSLNSYFRNLIPESIDWLSSVPDEGDDFHPHVIVQYPADVHIQAGDIDFETTRPNRVIFTYDPPSMALKISDAFIEKVANANVLLIASYNIIEDRSILMDRLSRTISIISSLPPSHTVIMEDGCFKNPDMRSIVTRTLSPYIDIFSMNEDELSDRFGHSIDILNPEDVAVAVKTVYSQINVPTLVCHSAHWALAYGFLPQNIRNTLKSGMLMASTRFRLGNDYNELDYTETAGMPDSKSGADFSKSLPARFNQEPFICIPSKDLSSVIHPTTIGLGDSFVGGMLPQLLPPSIAKKARFR